MRLSTGITGVMLLLSAAAIAQTGLYIKPAAGIGFTNIKAKTYSYAGISTPVDYNNIISYNAGVNIGYRLFNFDISTGIQFLSTGQKYDYFIGISDSGFLANRFLHMLIPLNIGYQIRVTEKFSVIPQVGAAYSYNIKRTDHIKTIVVDSRTTLNKDVFTNLYNRSSVFGTIRINVEYALTDKLSISVAPAYYRMISSFDNPDAYAGFNPKEKPYAVALELGTVIHLNKLFEKKMKREETQQVN